MSEALGAAFARGDLVNTALQRQYIDEHELRGKITKAILC